MAQVFLLPFNLRPMVARWLILPVESDKDDHSLNQERIVTALGLKGKKKSSVIC